MFKSSTRRQLLSDLIGANHGVTVRRATLATALALSISSIPAHAVIVDGNLTDLISSVGANPYNTAQGSESSADAENNGFDITNTYAFYDRPLDTLYIGMSFIGHEVGRAINSPNNESYFACTGGSNNNAFDCSEQYGFRLHLGSSTADTLAVRALYTGDGVVNSGIDTESLLTSGGYYLNTYGLTIHRAVSEANDGVEFSISGLYANHAITAFPQWLTVDFRAGSAENTLPEDSAVLSIQTVPVPAAAWLFGSGLVGLVAFARKRQQTA